MPESNEIMSVEGQLVGMPLAGPETFTAAQVEYLKRAMGLDETVLYENSTGAGTVQVPEDISNFERLGITYKLWNDNAGLQYVEVPANQTLFTLGSEFVPASGSVAHFYTRLTYASLTLTCARHCYVNSGSPSTVSDGTSTFKFLKLVGIHRISGGN